jgi:aconitate hydratase
MPSTNSFGARSTLTVAGRDVTVYSLDAVEGAAKLPYSLKVLLENLLRNEDGHNVTAEQITALAGWDPSAEPDTEIQFSPARVVMQDFTGVPCVVDLAAMREAMQALGGDPKKINPLVPTELVIDHSVIVDVFGAPDAFEKNAALEFERNQERYQFLRWGQNAFDGFKVVPPDTGIVHQVNLEYLARVVFEADGLPHHDDQRPWRARLGCWWHRSGGRHARPAGLDAHPARGRVQAVGRAARGHDRHRPGAHHYRDAA